MSSATALARYALGEAWDHRSDRGWWLRRAREWKNTPFYAASSTRRESLSVMDADWDTLVVLDACRVDLFEETVAADRFDAYRRVRSPASATSEWMRYSFPDEYGDTVYVAGSPMLARHAAGSFHRVEEVWRDGFDSELGTVPADHVTDAALDAHSAHPNKRQIVHYIQPHYPFVHDPDLQFWSWSGTPELDSDHADDRARHVWEALEKGLADRDTVWAAYRRNLEYVMEHVTELLDGIDGRTVITADHGNLVGERLTPVVGPRAYGHPPCRRHPTLTTVPWATVDSAPRREITEDAVESHSTASESEVDERLRALGYV
jgi:hypothetical protein